MPAPNATQLSALAALAFLALGAARSGAATAAAPDSAPLNAANAAAIRVEASDGKLLAPLAGDQARTRPAVFVFVSNVCPIANRYAPDLRRLAREYTPRGVTFWIVHPHADETAESIRNHTREYDLVGQVVRDPTMALTRLLGITVTPEVAVVDTDLHLAYRGRIDDRFPALGRKRPRATQHDLRNALDAVLAGKPVPNPRTQAVGCVLSIPE